MAGPFYFAWVDAAETTFSISHVRYDEVIFTFAIEHAEGDIPTLTLEIKNPKIGLLAPGRKIWAWLAWFDGVDYVPLFFGRLVAVPSDMFAEVITLQFVARPTDYADQKVSVADGLKIAPGYDPVWIAEDKRDDPDTVLEGYSSRWHIDRTTLDLTASDILIGEDGLEEFSEADAFYDSVSMSLDQVPLRSVHMTATLHWTQTASGTIDIGSRAFTSYTDGLLRDWPTPGADLGGGWSAAPGTTIVDVNRIENAQPTSYSYSWQNEQKEHADGDTLSISESYSSPGFQGKVIGGFGPVFGFIPDNAEEGTGASSEGTMQFTFAAVWRFRTTLVIQYDAKRERTEIVDFTLSADLQNVLTAPGEEEIELITLDGADVGVAINGTAPIGNASRRSYFPTDRGLDSVEYLLCVARAHLLARARVVRISFDCRFERAVNLSCRKSALLADGRLPGGRATGKIIKYSIKGDGDSVAFGGSITVACAVGLGNAIATAPGTPSYVELGYVDDYQHYDGTLVAVGAGDVAYSIPIDEADDDGLIFPLTRSQIIVRDEQMQELGDVAPALIARQGLNAIDQQQQEQKHVDAMTERLKSKSPWYELELKPVAGQQFDVGYDVTTSLLAVPMQVDLSSNV